MTLFFVTIIIGKLPSQGESRSRFTAINIQGANWDLLTKKLLKYEKGKKQG